MFTRLLSNIFHVSPQVAKAMLNQTLADHLRHKIWDNITHDNVSYYAESFSDADYGTTHVAVLAPNGDAVSVTTTITITFSQRCNIVSFCRMLVEIYSETIKSLFVSLKINVSSLNVIMYIELTSNLADHIHSGAPAARRAAKRSPISIPYMEI